MNVDYVNPVLEAILKIFSESVDMSFQPGKPQLKKDSISKGDVSGLIDMSSDDIKGSLSVSFAKVLILEVAKRMLDEEFDEINEDIEDCAAEFTNMICGDAKSRLSERGYSFELNVPSIISGPSHTIEHTVDAPIILMPFENEQGTIFVEICFKETSDIEQESDSI